MIEERRAVDVVYMAFRKAFDKVLHSRLIQKIRIHGIHGDPGAWVQYWPTHIRQRAVMEGCYSGWWAATSGITQGSELGPLLVGIYINDLDKNVYTGLQVCRRHKH